jgi:glucose-6-phosphate dehydrogenase assembly protein OpcA
MAEAVTGADAWNGVGVTIAEVVQRLAEQRCPPGGGPPYTLSGVLNLLAYAPSPAELGPMREVVERLADHQASRTVMIVEGGEDGGMDAAVSTACRRGGSTTLALELVVLTIHGDSREGAASACAPLLRSELPTLLWWPLPPDGAGNGALAGLAALAERVVTEADRGPDARAAVRALAGWAPGDEGRAVTDLAWAAITPWRQLIVQVLGPGTPRAVEPGSRAVVAHSAPVPDAGTLLMAGWLRDLLGPGAATELRARGDPGAGLLAVEVAGPDGLSLRVERLPGREAAAVTVAEPDGAVRSRTLPLPAPDRARLLAGELEILRRDRAFERALAEAGR